MIGEERKRIMSFLMDEKNPVTVVMVSRDAQIKSLADKVLVVENECINEIK